MSLYDPEPNKRPAPTNVMDLRGLNPAPVTVFDSEGKVDWAANADLAKWLADKEGVKSLVILGHAGEGTFLTTEEQVRQGLRGNLCRCTGYQHIVDAVLDVAVTQGGAGA